MHQACDRLVTPSSVHHLCVLSRVQNGWCLDVKTSDVTVFLGEERDSSNYLDYFLLDVSLGRGVHRVEPYHGGRGGAHSKNFQSSKNEEL